MVLAGVRRAWRRVPHIPTKWRYPKLIFGLFLFEMLAIVAALALFGVAQSDTWRTALWRDGNYNHFNSSPSQVLYAYANHVPLPKQPLVWSDLLIQYNVILSVFSMFVLILKPTLHILRIFWPLFSLIVHGGLCALWAFSVYAQQSADNSDPEYKAAHPWYLTNGCDVTFDKKNVKNCQLAKSAFAITVIMLVTYLIYVLAALHSLIWPKNKKGHGRSPSDDSENELKESWDMDELPKTPKPKYPMTPKTFAFNKLHGKA